MIDISEWRLQMLHCANLAMGKLDLRMCKLFFYAVFGGAIIIMYTSTIYEEIPDVPRQRISSIIQLPLELQKMCLDLKSYVIKRFSKMSSLPSFF